MGVLFQSEQRGGRRLETASKSDSLNEVAQACESRRAQPASAGLGASLLGPKKAPRERILPRWGTAGPEAIHRP